MNYPHKQQNYTIWQAKDDIKYLQSRIDALEAKNVSLEEEVSLLRSDEWRALELSKIALQRINVLETLVLMAFTPEGRKYFSHEVLTELRAIQKAGVQNG